MEQSLQSTSWGKLFNEHRAHVEGYGKETSIPNPPKNVFVIAYSFKSGNRQWVNMLGNMKTNNVHVQSGYYRGSLVVGIQSKTGKYSNGDTSICDISLASISPEDGYVKRLISYGGTGNTILKDLIINHMGVYLLGTVSKDLSPHPNPGSYFKMDSDSPAESTSLIWLSSDLDIFEMMVLPE